MQLLATDFKKMRADAEGKTVNRLIQPFGAGEKCVFCERVRIRLSDQQPGQPDQSRGRTD